MEHQTDTEQCSRCGRTIDIHNSEFLDWEAVEDGTSCEHCLTGQEVYAIADDAMQTAVESSVCMRCLRSYLDLETFEFIESGDPRFDDTDNWIVTDEGVIFPYCVTGGDVMAAFSSTIAGIEQLGAMRRELGSSAI